MIVVVLGCENIGEIFSDTDALQYFLEPRRNDVVVSRYSVSGNVVRKLPNAVEPGFYAREVFDLAC